MSKELNRSKKGRRFRVKTTAHDFNRPLSPSQSLAQSIHEMRLMREGKLPKKSWWDYIKEQKDKEEKF